MVLYKFKLLWGELLLVPISTSSVNAICAKEIWKGHSKNVCGLTLCVCVCGVSKHPVFQVASVCILEDKKAHTISLMWCYSCAIFSALSPDRHLCLFVCKGPVWTVAWCPCFVGWQEKCWGFWFGFVFIFRKSGDFFASVSVDSNNFSSPGWYYVMARDKGFSFRKLSPRTEEMPSSNKVQASPWDAVMAGSLLPCSTSFFPEITVRGLCWVSEGLEQL